MHRYIVNLTIVLLLLCHSGSASDATMRHRKGPVVRIDSGRLEGVYSPDYPKLASFRSIPYAAPPVGELRWKPPQPPARWHGTRKADELSSACPQSDRMFRIRQRIVTTLGGDLSMVRPADKTSEDCLYLNVMTTLPDHKERLPVMVFIHGGGGVIGRGDDDGATLARAGVVVVTINYRLGVVGWLSHPALTSESPHHSSGNYGLLDQIAALRWVRRNIAQFGGDPGNVTVFGHSSGGEYVGCLMVSPLARGLFQRAIMQSGVPLQLLPSVHHPGGEVESSEALGVALAQSLGAGDGPGAIKKLRSIPTDQLINNDISYDTVVDGWIIPEQPLAMFAQGQHADIPIMVGGTEREFGNLIVLVPDRSAEAFRAWLRQSFQPIADDLLRIYPTPSSGDATESFIRAKTDLEMIAPARWLARTTQRQKNKAYLYDVTWTFGNKGGQEWGAFHGIDVLLLFDSPRVPRTENGDTLAQAMRNYWVQFAKTGDPNTPGLPEWPTYDSATGSYLELGPKIRSAAGLHEDAFDPLDRLYTTRLRAITP